MSLINQMLQDLEKRQGASDSSGPLPVGVHSAALAQPSRRGPLLLVAALAILAMAGGATYWMQSRNSVTPPAVLPATPQLVAISAPEAPPVTVQLSSPAPAPLEAAASATVQADPAPAPVASVTVLPKAKAGARKVASKKHSANQRLATRGKSTKHRTQLASKAQNTRTPAVKIAGDSEAQLRAEAEYRDALAAFGQGRTADSLEMARRALENFPGHIAARQLLVRQLIEQRANDQARQALRQGLQHQPTQVQWSTWLIRLEMDRGDLTAARQVLDQALPHAGNQADFQSLAGALAQRQGKPDEAAGFYRTALQLKPGDGRSWIGLGLALEAEGHAAESREAFRRALSLENLSPELQALAQRKLN